MATWPLLRMTGVLYLLAAGFVLYWAAIVFYIARTLTHPPRRTYARAIARGEPGDPSELSEPLPFQRWTLPWRAGDLPVWDIACPQDGPVVIFTHGWASSRLGALRRIGHIADCAGRIIAWDMPGHGEAPGRCAIGIREPGALVALVRELRRQGEQRPIVLQGSSLGAGVAIAAGAQLGADVALVIAEAPYRTPPVAVRGVLRERGVAPLGRARPAVALAGLLTSGDPLLRGFDRAGLAARLTCPLLVIHGTGDEISPIADGEAIARAARQGSLIAIEGAGHRDLWSDEHRSMTVRAIREALASIQSADDDERLVEHGQSAG
ncbi:MAG: alpha/beta fold hydrolase [Phycisphaerales bacterium JB039]